MTATRRARPGAAGVVVAVGAGLGAALAGPSAATAQDPDPDACRTVMEEAFGPPGPGNACQALAGSLVLALTEAFWVEVREAADLEEQLAAGDLQPALSGSSTPAGFPGQPEPVPSGQPVAVGGGSFSAVGSGADGDAVTSLTLNPLTLLRDGLARFARDSRTLDVSLWLPVDELDRDGDGDIDYWGARLRVNLTGAAAGDRVWTAATERFEGLLEGETRAAAALLARLGTMTADRMRACVRAVRGGLGPGGVEAACGAGVALPTEDEYAAFRAALDEVRVRADARYLGVDLRVDSGDPTLGAVADADATTVTASVGAGRQFLGADARPLAPTLGLRGRLGLRYADLSARETTSFGVEGAAAIVLRRPLTVEQDLTVSAGLDFRVDRADETLEGPLQTDWLSVRAALSVPVVGGAAVTIGFSHPLLGDAVSPAVTVGGDWRLLLAGLPGSG